MAFQSPARQLGRALQCSSASLRSAYAPRALRSVGRLYSSSVTADDVPSPLMQKLKGDLKSAMRAKDASRLSVLRSIMSANLNASKTDKPIRTDLELVTLIRKLERNAEQAVDEAKAAKREDLVEKEQQQADILREYVENSGIKSVRGDDLMTMIQATIEMSRKGIDDNRRLMGIVISRVKAATKGQDVDAKELATLVKQALNIPV